MLVSAEAISYENANSAEVRVRKEFNDPALPAITQVCDALYIRVEGRPQVLIGFDKVYFDKLASANR